jgi:hypothetical protein
VALAIIQFDSSAGDGARLRIDIGKNRYYSYAIGGEETTPQSGLETLLDPPFTSPVLGPLAEEAMGRTLLVVPGERFDREHRRIQLASYRTRDRVGPAVSRIITVPAAGAGLDALPPPAYFAETRSSVFSTGETMTTTRTRVENVPYSYQRAQTYSSAMFLQILTSLLPAVMPVLGSLLGGAAKPSGNGSSGKDGVLPANLLAKLGDPETVRLLTELMKQISGAKSTSKGIVYHDPEAHFAATQSLSRYREQFSEAKIAPALLAALPALMPLLEKALNPDTIKAIMENVDPTKLIGAVTESIGTLGKLGMENQKQLQDHLERLNPGVKNAELYKLLEGLSTGEARIGSRLDYKRVNGVTLRLLRLTDGPAPTLYGRSRLAYMYGQDLAFPLELETPKPIREAVLEVSLKEADTLRVLYEKVQPVGGLSGGAIEPAPRIPWSALSKTRAGEDYLLTFVLCWKPKGGSGKRGTSTSQLITLVSEYAFDRVEDSSPDLVSLANPTSYGDYWHKVWDRTFEGRGMTRVRFSCDYCYVLDGDRTSNGRMESKSKLAESAESRREEGKLKSGMVLSPDVLNKLISSISDGTPLTEGQLEALRSPDFVDRFNQAAKTQVDFKGRGGDSVALWVYPEMKMQNVVLKRVSSVGEHGDVQAFEEETVVFPMPALAHFVGASSAE